MRRVALWLAAIGLVLAFAAVALWSFGPSAALAYINGEYIVVESPDRNLGTVTPNQVVAVNFSVQNRWREPIEIVGCETACTCVVTDDLPRTIPAGESIDFRVTYTAPEKGNFAQDIKLFSLGGDKFLRIHGVVTN